MAQQNGKAEQQQDEVKQQQQPVDCDYSRGHWTQITPELRAEAKQHANGYVYSIDNTSGRFTSPNSDVPPQFIAGCWKVDTQGEIVGDFIPNPNYRPTTSTSAQQQQ